MCRTILTAAQHGGWMGVGKSEKGQPSANAHTREDWAWVRITPVGMEGGTSNRTLWKETHRTWRARFALVGWCSPIIPTLLRNVAQDKCPLAGVMRADGKTQILQGMWEEWTPLPPWHYTRLSHWLWPVKKEWG